MSRKTIAPSLRRFLNEGSLPCKPSGVWTEESAALWTSAHRELLAVRALVRAAERVSLPPEKWFGLTADERNKRNDDLARALARLSRASRQGGRS